MPSLPPSIRRGNLSRSSSGSSSDDDGSLPGKQNNKNKNLDPPVLVYHESARSIVFRDHIRRAVANSHQEQQQEAEQQEQQQQQQEASLLSSLSSSSSSPMMDSSSTKSASSAAAFGVGHKTTVVTPPQPPPPPSSSSLSSPTLGTTRTSSSTASHPSRTTADDNNNNNNRMVDLQHTSTSHVVVSPPSSPRVVPLPSMELGPSDCFTPLLEEQQQEQEQDEEHGQQQQQSTATAVWTDAEREVVQRFHDQTCVVKTIKNVDWTDFLRHFIQPKNQHSPRQQQQQSSSNSNNNSNSSNSNSKKSKFSNMHSEIEAESNNPNRIFRSFVTSTSLLPSGGKKMRCYGSTNQYVVGVVFGLPTYNNNNKNNKDEYDDDIDNEEDIDVTKYEVWSWPAGYSAKTEFNIDSYGRLINGRQEALVSLSGLRKYNTEYLLYNNSNNNNQGTNFENQYITIGTRRVQANTIKQIPYNEVFVRVGGPIGRCLVDDNKDSSTVQEEAAAAAAAATGGIRSFSHGIGIPIALFVRTATYGHLISLMRTRARMISVLGEQYVRGIPLLLITPELGVRVLTESLQKELWSIASRNLNPFQNPTIAHKTTIHNTDEGSFQEKVDELIDLDETIRELLTPQELACLAGGFGATDASITTILQEVMMEDKRRNQQDDDNKYNNETNTNGGVQPRMMDRIPPPAGSSRRRSHLLQDVVNEGLAAAVRSGDYHTSRQLLILYSLVASSSASSGGDDDDENDDDEMHSDQQGGEQKSNEMIERPDNVRRASSLGRDLKLMQKDLDIVISQKGQQQQRRRRRDATSAGGGLTTTTASRPMIIPSPPPPPLDTDRLRSATNSDGLLAVLGAAQVLKSIQDGSAYKRVYESISAVQEWINHGENSITFRISSWYDQRTAQDDLKIATKNNSNFMAFVSNKAISNRKAFTEQLMNAISTTTTTTKTNSKATTTTTTTTNFNDLHFLQMIDDMLSKMHSPCLRLELLQYVLGLDNRYSVAHVSRSVELATTCLSILPSFSSSSSCSS